MKKYTPYEETVQMVELLKQKPEIDQKIKYYKEVIKATDNLINSIDERVSKGFTVESFRFIGVNVNKRVLLDSYDAAKLVIEKQEAENKLYTQKNYFESWLKRSAEYDKKYSEIIADCDANFDAIMAEAEIISQQNIRLANVMKAYSNPDNNQKLKTEYYLYCKQEVQNRKKAVQSSKHQTR